MFLYLKFSESNTHDILINFLIHLVSQHQVINNIVRMIMHSLLRIISHIISNDENHITVNRI